MHSAAPELAPRGVERGLIGTILISALVHAAAIGLLIAVPGRFLSAPPRLQSYTVDLVAPDVIGGTNLIPGGGAKKPAPAKVEPEVGEPGAEVVPPAPAAAPPPPKPAEPEKPIEAAKPVEPPKPPPVAAEPPKPPPPAPKPVEAKPLPKPVEAKPPEPPKPAAEAPKPKPAVEAKPVPKPPPPPVAAKAPEKPAPKPVPEKPVEAAAKPAVKPEAKPAAKPDAKPEAKAEAKPDTKPKPEAPPAKPAPAKAEANAKPVDAAQQRDQAINAAVQKRAAEAGQREAADARIAAAVQKRAQQLEKGGSGAAGAGGPIAAGPGAGVGGTPTDMVYILYLGRMSERIKGLWAWTGSDQNLSVDVEFRVAPEGQISNVRTVRSSGDTSFDASAERAVRAANPLEAVPEKYRDAFARVTLTFQPSDLEH